MGATQGTANQNEGATMGPLARKLPKMTNKQDKCECGSDYMPTIMEQDRNRWACRECYNKPVPKGA